MESKNIAQLIKSTEKFKFSAKSKEIITVSKVLEIITKVDESYRNYSILNQVERIQFMPYVLVFKANQTIILQPFIEVFEALKVYLKSICATHDTNISRFIIHDRFIIIDVNPDNSTRSKIGTYSIDKKSFILNEDNIAQLDYFQEVEIKIDSTLEVGFKLSKKV